MTPRTASRVAAVQALYQMDLAGTEVNEVIDEFVRLRFADTHPILVQGEKVDPINSGFVVFGAMVVDDLVERLIACVF